MVFSVDSLGITATGKVAVWESGGKSGVFNHCIMSSKSRTYLHQ